MKKIACVYTGMGKLPMEIEGIFKAELGEIKFHHILDSGLISDIITAEGVNPKLEKRIYTLFDAAALTESDIIVSTCSSVGEVAQKYAADHPEVSMLSIDYPMAKYAADNGRKVVVLATLATTVKPSANLVRKLAKKAGRDIEVLDVAVSGAFNAMINGDMEKATKLVMDAVKETCADADIVLLAQASMSAFRPALERMLGDGVKIMESPASCALYIKNM